MNIKISMLKITDRYREKTLNRPTAILTIWRFCGKKVDNQVKSNMYNVIAIRLHPVGCAKENPVGIRNDTVTVNGELFSKPLGNREGKAAWNQVRRTALS